MAEQGMEVGGYDVVIASNVLHATKEIRRTLRTVKAALKRNGMLIMNELSGSSVYAHLTFGLLEGWWCYQDEAIREPGTPGLSAGSWRRVLQEEGYRAIGFAAPGAHEYGQQVIVAHSDGVIRQPFGEPLRVPLQPPIHSSMPVVASARYARRAPIAARLESAGSVSDSALAEQVRITIRAAMGDV